jgi:hypothetical protein
VSGIWSTMGTLRAGDWVEVRSKAEILATLDESGMLGGMPFMPEMLKYCGQRFRVQAIAHKTCDTATKTGGRSLDAAVHLEELRCDGSAHGGCQAECLIFWQEGWLRGGTPPVSDDGKPSGCTEEQLEAAVLTSADSGGQEDPRYVCQATRLPLYTRLLHWWDLRQYARDVSSGNHRLLHVLRVLFLAGVRTLLSLPVGYRVFRSVYDALHRRITGRRSPFVEPEALASSHGSAQDALGLQPGERVRVKPLEAIAPTLNAVHKNRGLYYGPDMSRYCGETFTVRRRITQIIDEQTGKMIRMKNPCITLNGVVCAAEYSDCRLLCPRAITPYWRELWLERAAPETAPLQ